MSKEKKQKQVRNLFLFIGGGMFLAILFVLFLPEDPPQARPSQHKISPMPTEDPSFSSEKVRLSHIEVQTDTIKEDLLKLKKSLLDLEEDKTLLQKKNQKLENTTSDLRRTLSNIQIEKKTTEKATKDHPSTSRPSNAIHIWGTNRTFDLHNVATEIPAGTVVKCMVVSTAYCGVGVNAAANPRVILLQPVDNGKLPWKIRVALKGSRILCSAVGDLASERAYVRAETLTKMIGKGGDFIETAIAGCVIGDDGAEGIRGVVVDRSGSIILRAGFASFLQGIGQGINAALNNQTLAKLGKIGDTQSILNVDTFRNAGIQGGNTSLNKLSEYYIKRAEQLQPVIQITRRPVRKVDVLFLKSVKIGKQNIRGKITQEKKERASTW